MHKGEGVHIEHCCSPLLAELSPPSLAVELLVAQASNGPWHLCKQCHLLTSLRPCLVTAWRCVGESLGIGHSLNSQP